MLQKTLRKGYTTGTCAQAAAKAAAQVLLNVREPDRIRSVEVRLPKGESLEIPVFEIRKEKDRAFCSVRKDSGDDPDITDGALVCANISKCCLVESPEKNIVIEGGRGIGRVTKAGLDQPVGAAAINSVPRQMILQEIRSVCEEAEYTEGICVEISIPGGEELAKKTFNPRLGVEGGLSVLGTSGIVEPMSEQALLDTIFLELKVKMAENKKGVPYVILTPGNYGLEFLEKEYGIRDTETVKCSNYIGESLDMAGELNCTGVILAGHIGKLIKLSGGIMNTHSHCADCRMELLAAAALRAGMRAEKALNILSCRTTDEALGVCTAGERKAVMSQVMKKIEEYLSYRTDSMRISVIVFSKVYGILGKTPNADAMICQWKKESR